MSVSLRSLASVIGAVPLIAYVAACAPVNVGQPSTTNVGATTATYVQTSGLVDPANDCSVATPPAPDPQARWNAMSPTDRQFPMTGFEIWRNTNDGCQTSRLDVYRAVASFNMASVASLRGLVTRAELIVGPRALPAATGMHPQCLARTGGAGALERFGPATEGNLPAFNSAGSLIVVPPAQAFPVATNVVFTVPDPWAAGTVSGAANPTTGSLTGQGPGIFVVDVTGAVNAAINGGMPRMSYAFTSAFPGPLAGVAAPGGVDCRTPVEFRLALTHY